MNTTKKLVIAVVALSLALIAFASVTLAWLVDTTDVVTNTFTYGHIDITLTETKGDVQSDGSRLFDKVIPGDEVAKDPKVTVELGSEKCYVYVKITNTLVNSTIVTDLDTQKWIPVDGDATLYRYFEVVDASTAAKELPVFTKVTFPGDLTVDDIDALEAATNNIIIKAYAHQSENAGIDVANAAALAWSGAN